MRMSLRSLRPVAGLAAVLAALAVPAAEDRPQAYAVAVDLQPQGSESLQRLRLPLAVLQASRAAGWADLRVFDGEGRALPMAWSGTPQAAPPPLRELALTPLRWPGTAPRSGSEAAGVVVDAGDVRVQIRRPVPGATASVAGQPEVWFLDLATLGEERPRALRLDWAPLPDGQGLVRQVRAEASTDAQQWRAVGSAVLVELPAAAGEARHMVHSRLALATLDATLRYLRLSADGPWPLRAVQAEVLGDAPDDETSLDSLRLPLPEDGVLDPGAALPLRGLALHFEGGTGVAPFSLQRPLAPAVAGQPVAWQVVASGTAYRLQQGGSTIESPPLPLSVAPAARWQLRFAPEATLRPQAVTLRWRAPELVVATSGRPPYRLAVGRADASPAMLPLATLMPGYRRGDEHRLPQASLGPLVARDGAGSLFNADPAALRRWLLWAALAGAVVGLGVLAWRLAREMKAPPG
ncbi:DUF3999 family protein [Ideonella sp. 4Y11]|uniref:DUF3999 family protein n=1 Tax=Ideonella aquatica TaxID=2824119 RepID=A0A940YGJ8_9BURK|nr:DUF3999 family protein [Ideonella aquatica]MBQ0958989.1 DUF3999 family protein [Ideonella aquatica]